jgi:cytochrome c oxidase accessory protein FixG
MCPSARFQSEIFYRNTLIIASAPMRGEPRGPRRRGLASVLESGRGLLNQVLAYEFVFRASGHPAAGDAMAQARAQAGMVDDANFIAELATPLERPAPEVAGDCIDCTLCVQVCPTGIDIRNGLQYDCIACGACVDACDGVMLKMGYPKGLIRYSTQNAIDGKPTRVLRPRILVYGVVLSALIAGWAWSVGGRTTLIAEVLRDRNTLYRSTSDGRVENGYTLKLINKTDRARTYRVEVKAATGIDLAGGSQLVSAQAQQVVSVPLIVTAPATARGRQTLRFNIQATDGSASETIDSSFFGPMR